MANLKVEQYIETVAANLQSLSESERKSQIDELCQHLEALAAANHGRGQTEEAAIEAAIRQFGGSDELGRELKRMAWRARLKRLPENLAFVLYAMSAIVLIKIVMDFGVSPILRLVTESLHEPSAQPHAKLIVPKFLTPSLLLGLSALALLIGRDGVRGAFTRFIRPETVIGAAFCWTTVYTLGSSLIMAAFIALYNLMIPASQQWLGFGALVSFFVLTVPAYSAGWIVSRRSGSSALPGILVGIATSMVMWLADFLLRWWQSSSTATWQPFEYLQTAVPYITSALLTIPFAVAPVLLRNIRSGRNIHEPAS
jgi:hypothetical protein